MNKPSRFINPVVHFWTDRYVIDTTLSYVWSYTEFGLGLMYKLGAQQGEQWVMINHGGGGFEICRVVAVRQATMFGIPTTIKDYRYFFAFDSTDTLGVLSRGEHSLAARFGLTYMGGGDLFYSLHLKGTVIGGILYGDTTRVLTSVLDVSANVPHQLQLSPNYPNPFNPETTIEFDVPTTSDVTLRVYNVLGEVVATIAKQRFQPGGYKLTWNASGLPSGVYFYRLEAGGFSQTMKALLLR
ncbi:MAG: T9SS type A sorting domain-containing protein [Ignavibacteriae bacterium]|nr:T9SS type A sorting domain-containing protein [Ignavibacteriota bacterium]